MRILQVITSLQIGGAEKLIAEITPMLRDKGHQVDVLAFDGVETHFTQMLKQQGIKIISFGKNCNVYNPLFIFKLAKLMRHYDIVHTHNTASQLFAAIASLLCSVLLCTTEHTTSNRRRGWKWYARVDRWMYRCYRRIICISDSTETNLREFIGEQSDKIVTIYNGINVSAYSNATAIDKASLTAHPSRKVVAMVAGFRIQKDQETLIRAISHLPSDIELWLVGDGERRPLIEKCITENDLSARVHLLGVRSNIPAILKAADIVVQSSHWEGFGLAAVEGMAAGKPVIASNVAGLAQVVESAGILFPHGDDKALAAKIERLAFDPDHYRAVADRCYRRALQFDISKMVDQYNQIYQSIISNNG